MARIPAGRTRTGKVSGGVWTRVRVIRVLKRAYRAGRDLSWTAVVGGRGELRRAAFAAVRRRLFGSWDRALHAAGLHAGDIARYRSWDRTEVVAELRELAADGERLSSGRMRREDPGLHAAAVRYFGSWPGALRRAGVSVEKARERRRWTAERVLAALRKRRRRGEGLSGTVVRREDPALYGAAVRYWGGFRAAREAALGGAA